MKTLPALLAIFLVSNSNLLTTGSDTVYHLEKSKPVNVNESVAVTFSGHPVEKPSITSGALLDVIITIRTGSHTASKTYRCQNDNTEANVFYFTSDGYEFFITGYSYNEYIDAIIKKTGTTIFTQNRSCMQTTGLPTSFCCAKFTEGKASNALIVFNDLRITQVLIARGSRLSNASPKNICRCPFSPRYLTVSGTDLPDSSIVIVYKDFSRIEIVNGKDIAKAIIPLKAQPREDILKDLQHLPREE